MPVPTESRTHAHAHRKPSKRRRRIFPVEECEGPWPYWLDVWLLDVVIFLLSPFYWLGRLMASIAFFLIQWSVGAVREEDDVSAEDSAGGSATSLLPIQHLEIPLLPPATTTSSASASASGTGASVPATTVKDIDLDPIEEKKQVTDEQPKQTYEASAAAVLPNTNTETARDKDMAGNSTSRKKRDTKESPEKPIITTNTQPAIKAAPTETPRKRGRPPKTGPKKNPNKALPYHPSDKLASHKAWQEMFAELTLFFNEYGHHRVPEANKKLQNWASTQRRMFRDRRLSSDRMKLMKSIDFEFVVSKGPRNSPKASKPPPRQSPREIIELVDTDNTPTPPQPERRKRKKSQKHKKKRRHSSIPREIVYKRSTSEEEDSFDSEEEEEEEDDEEEEEEVSDSDTERLYEDMVDRKRKSRKRKRQRRKQSDYDDTSQSRKKTSHRKRKADESKTREASTSSSRSGDDVEEEATPPYDEKKYARMPAQEEDLPPFHTALFHELKFCEYARHTMPCMVVNPFDLDPNAGLRQSWNAMVKKHLRLYKRLDDDDLKYLVYWFSDQTYSIVEPNKLIPWEQGKESWKVLPNYLLAKLEKDKSLTEAESMRIEGHEDWQEQAKKPPSQRTHPYMRAIVAAQRRMAASAEKKKKQEKTGKNTSTSRAARGSKRIKGGWAEQN